MTEGILLIPNNMKKELILKIRKEYPKWAIKFMSLEEFKDFVTFSYDSKTIYYLMEKYLFSFDTALVYLKNLRYISNELDNHKMRKLKEIKAYLEENNLLNYDHYFRDFAKKQKIYIYGYPYLKKEDLSILKDFDYQITLQDKKNYKLEKIYYASSITDEVIFVATRIYELLKQNISYEHIKIIYTKEYEEIIRRIFKIYHIKINISKGSIYSKYACKKVLANLDNLNDVLDELSNDKIKKKIIDVLNKYSFLDDKKKAIPLIKNDLKKTYMEEDMSGVQIISLDDYIEEDDYVFLLGFNKENYPKIMKDSDYFTDSEKEIIGLDTSDVINAWEREKVINKLLQIKNLVVTYKLFDSSNNYTRCSLFDNVQDEEITLNNYHLSHMMNKIFLTERLDNLVKYNIKDNDLGLLYANYQIPYLEYDNDYKQIDKDKLYKYVENNLTLSYTSLDIYNKCHFCYYLSYILKLNEVKDTFSITIGNVCHFVLSKMDNDDFSVSKYFADYFQGKSEGTAKENFILRKVKEELEFIVSTIRKQQTYTTFTEKMYEKDVKIKLSNKAIDTFFKGKIDKILYREDNDATYAVVIDYKTGNTDIKLNYMKYGIGMQLPMYLYLLSQMPMKNIQIVGFYLQKILANVTESNNKTFEEAKEDTLKLEGYSLNDEHILSLFDKTYQDSKLIKSLKMTKNGFSSYSKIIGKEDITKFLSTIEEQIDKASDRILQADFSINPKVIEGKNVSCAYCKYRDICYRRERNIEYIDGDDSDE